MNDTVLARVVALTGIETFPVSSLQGQSAKIFAMPHPSCPTSTSSNMKWNFTCSLCTNSHRRLFPKSE